MVNCYGSTPFEHQIETTMSIVATWNPTHWDLEINSHGNGSLSRKTITFDHCSVCTADMSVYEKLFGCKIPAVGVWWLPMPSNLVWFSILLAWSYIRSFHVLKKSSDSWSKNDLIPLLQITHVHNSYIEQTCPNMSCQRLGKLSEPAKASPPADS